MITYPDERVDARLAFHSRTPWHISKVLFLMQKYNLFQYTPNISNYNEHWNRPHVHPCSQLRFALI